MERYRPSISLVAIILGAVSLSGCGDDGYGGSIETCKPGDDTEISATPGTRDRNDPFVLLASKSGDYIKDSRAQVPWIFKQISDDRGFVGASGPRDFNTDYADLIGEVVCIPPQDNTNAPRNYNLVFTPSGLERRNAYSNSH